MPLHDQLQVGDEGAALAEVEREELVGVIKKILSSYNERRREIYFVWIVHVEMRWFEN
jgi:RNA polymerase sigma factor for flagellar operon FliA